MLTFSVRYAVGVIGVGKINIIVVPTAFLLPILPILITNTHPARLRNTRTFWGKQVADNNLRDIVIVLIFIFVLARFV
jgi:hypothetical protein